MSDNDYELPVKKSKKATKRPAKKPRAQASNDDGDNGKQKSRSAYHIFLQERMAKLKKDSPGLPPKEYLSTVVGQWRGLPEEERKVYAEKSKQEKITTMSRVDVVTGRNGEKEKHIPIYTQAFIIHNRDREREFRRLQRHVSEVQQQSALLSAHADSLRTAIARLEGEVDAQRTRSSSLLSKLEVARSSVVEALVDISCNVTESTLSAEILKPLSTADLLQNLRNTISKNVSGLSDEERDYVKTALLAVLDKLSESAHEDTDQK